MASHGRYNQPASSILCWLPFEKQIFSIPSLRTFSSIGHSDRLLGDPFSSTVTSRMESEVRVNAVWGDIVDARRAVAGELVLASITLNDSNLGSLLIMEISKVRLAFRVFFNFNFLKLLAPLVWYSWGGRANFYSLLIWFLCWVEEKLLLYPLWEEER